MSTVFFYNNTDDYNSSCIYWGDAVIHNITRNATQSCIGYWSGTTGGTGAYTVINGLNFNTVPSSWTTSDVYFLSATWYVDPPSTIYSTYGYRNLFAGDASIFAKGKSFQVQIHPVEYTSGPHIDFQVFGTDFTATRYSINNSASTDTNVLAKSYYMYLYSIGLNSNTTFYCEVMNVNKTYTVSSTSTGSSYILRYFPCGHNGHCTITNNSSVAGYQYFFNSVTSTSWAQTPITIAAGGSYKNTNTIPTISNRTARVYFVLSKVLIAAGLKYGFYEGYQPNQTFLSTFYYSLTNLTGSLIQSAFSGTRFYTTYWVMSGNNLTPLGKNYFGVSGLINSTDSFTELTDNYHLAQPFLLESAQNWNVVNNRIISPASTVSTNDFAYMYKSCTADFPGVSYDNGTNTMTIGGQTNEIVVPCFQLRTDYTTTNDLTNLLTVKAFNWSLPTDSLYYYIPLSSLSSCLTLSNSDTVHGLNVQIILNNSSGTTTWNKNFLVNANSTLTVDLSNAEAGSTIRIVSVKYAYNAYVHNGSAWNKTLAYVYVDGAWKIAKPYIHNGTTWKEVKEFV